MCPSFTCAHVNPWILEIKSCYWIYYTVVGTALNISLLVILKSEYEWNETKYNYYNVGVEWNWDVRI